MRKGWTFTTQYSSKVVWNFRLLLLPRMAKSRLVYGTNCERRLTRWSSAPRGRLHLLCDAARRSVTTAADQVQSREQAPSGVAHQSCAGLTPPNWKAGHGL